MPTTRDLYLNARRYYAAWADVTPETLDQPGTTFRIWARRDERVPGYSNPIEFYCLVRPQTVVACVGSAWAARNRTFIGIPCL